MNINLPDTIYKFLVLAGTIIVGYYFFSLDNLQKEYMGVYQKLDKAQDSIDIMRFKNRLELEKLKGMAADSSERYNVPNPLIDNDSVLVFTTTYSGNPKKVLVSSSLHPLWLNYLESKDRLKIAEIQLEILRENHDEAVEHREYYDYWYYGPLLIIGLVFIVIGGIWWYEESNKGIMVEGIVYKYCQSCAKQFSAIIPYGRNKNKSNNLAFCKNCYDKGKFKEPKMTKDLLIQRIEENKDLSKRKKKNIKYRIDNLLRWKKHHY